MTKTQYQQGFTLVELAIVLTIIGLLIGGILKGQQLMQNARVTATIAQVSAIEASTTTFRDTYNNVPGDMPNANTRVPNCANCGLAVAATAGDGIIGATGWNMSDWQSASFTGGATAGTAANETVLFWVELAKAGLLSGITDDGITNVPAIWGGSLPTARVGGGWIVGFAGAPGAGMPGRALALNMAGTVLALTQTALNVNGAGGLTATAGVQVLTPSTAAQMDRKMDDGLPGTGFVQSYGLGTSCYSVVAPATATSPNFLETIPAKDCGLYFRIQG